MRNILKYGKVAVEHPDDYNARAQVMWTGTLAHNDICGCDRDQDWASHMIPHRIGAKYDSCLLYTSEPRQAVMIGDKDFDCMAAKANGLFMLGCAYGFGSIPELHRYKADLIISSPKQGQQVTRILRRQEH